MSRNKTKIMNYLHSLAINPKAQIKRLFIGTLLSAAFMLAIIFTSSWENQWLFYFLAACLGLSVLYAIPGYLGVWVWRMHDVIFKNNLGNKTKEE